MPGGCQEAETIRPTMLLEQTDMKPCQKPWLLYGLQKGWQCCWRALALRTSRYEMPHHRSVMRRRCVLTVQPVEGPPHQAKDFLAEYAGSCAFICLAQGPQ